MSAQKVCIVGAETLLGRELREQLGERRFPGRLVALGSPEEAGFLSDEGGEAAVIPPLKAEELDGAAIVFCAGARESTLKAYEAARGMPAVPAFIDLTYGLEEYANARLRSPSLDTGEIASAPDTLHVIAHPAATAIALILTRIQKRHPISHAVIQVFEPASERGQRGIHELQQQTAGLLSFRPLEKEVFDAQAAFNLLPRYGEDAEARLDVVEQRIDRHLASLFAVHGPVPMPSVRLAHAPVFHGYSLSLWVDFEARVELSSIGESLGSARVEVRGSDVEPPSNVGAVGQSGVTVGTIEQDRNHATAVWIWAVADNFRVMADDAIDIARSLSRAEIG